MANGFLFFKNSPLILGIVFQFIYFYAKYSNIKVIKLKLKMLRHYFLKFKAIELIQNLLFVGLGPSSKTCPR